MKRIIICIVFIVLFKSVIFSQDLPATVNINLAEAIYYAKVNPKGSFAISVNDLYRSKLGLKIQDINRGLKYSYSGSVNASNYTNSFSNSLSGQLNKPFIWGSTLNTGLNLAQSSSRSSNATIGVSPFVNVSMPLDANLMYYNDYSADNLDRSLIKSQLSLLDTEKSLILSIISNYFQILQSLKSMNFEEEKYSFYKRFSEISTKEVELGKTKEMVLMESEVQQLQSANNILSMRNNIEISLKNFKQLLNIPDTANIDLNPVDLEIIPYEKYVIPDIEQAIMNPTLIVNKMNLKDSEVSLKSNRSKVTPSLVLNANLNSTNTNFRDWPFSTSAGVSYPLFNEPEYENSMSSQLSSYKDSVNSFENAILSRRIYLETLVNTFQTNIRNYQMAKKQLEIQKQLIKIYTVQYSIGQLSLQIFVDRRNDYTNQQNNYENTLQSLFQSYSSIILEFEGVNAWYEKVLKGQLKLIK